MLTQALRGVGTESERAEGERERASRESAAR